jgi:SAM-dependent methyltransferase
MRCRICESEHVLELGTVEFYLSYRWSIFECLDCRCRFTRYDSNIYNLLHGAESSRYSQYRELAHQCELLFAERNLDGIRELLGSTPKYRFVIEEIEARKGAKRILEIGCSRGYLSSFFILAGYEILAVDLSTEAVRAARAAFGEHFCLAGSKSIQERQPYDVIYHVGTIGCVEDPMGYTKSMLDMLGEGGILLFNAPNADACWLPGQLWVNSAPPPDVVTLFRKGFWTQYFSSIASVQEITEYCEPGKAFSISARKILRVRWQRPEPIPLTGMEEPATQGRLEGRRSLATRAARALRSIAVSSETARSLLRQPTEFGLFIKMVKE